MLMKKTNVSCKKTIPTLLITLLLACFGLSPAAQATRHSLPRLPAPVATGSDAAARTLINPVTTPQWTSSFNYTTDTALAAASAVYDPATNTMMVFGGLDWGMEGSDTNAVLLYAPANGNGNWTTLIANGALGSPPARDFHTAVYDSANNRMII